MSLKIRASAFVLLATLAAAPAARADGAAPPTASPAEQARERFSAGVVLLRDPVGPRYEEAYREFNAAYRLSPSPKMLSNIGLCSMKLERDGEAIAAYTKFLESTPDVSTSEREQIERDVTTLRAGAVRISVASVPPGATIRDTRIAALGDRVTNTYVGATELTVRQGHHLIVASLAGYPDQSWEVDADGGATLAHTFAFGEGPRGKPSEAMRRPIPTSVYVGGAATLALGAGATIAGLAALVNRERYDEQNGRDAAAAASLRDEGQTLNLLTDVFLVGTAVAAGVTVVLLLTRPPEGVGASSSSNKSSHTTRSRLPALTF